MGTKVVIVHGVLHAMTSTVPATLKVQLEESREDLRQCVVNRLGVFGETVENSSKWRHFEESHRRTQDVEKNVKM